MIFQKFARKNFSTIKTFFSFLDFNISFIIPQKFVFEQFFENLRHFGLNVKFEHGLHNKLNLLKSFTI